MSRNKGFSAKEGVIPPDVEWVDIEATDGDSRRWPTNTTPNPDAEGHVNFMQPLGLDNPFAIKWRLTIGKALAEMHKYPGYKEKTWALRAWPAGYQFYDHNKGQQNGNVRHDLYLVGSEHVARFRSPPEFIPHAYWLMTDTTGDRSKCFCKYCAKVPQRNISDAFGLTQSRGALSSQAASQARVPTKDPRKDIDKERRRNNRRELQRVYANVRRVPKPVKLPKGPKEFVVPEREKDLRALLGPKQLSQRRWAREGELIWVKLDLPIMLGSSAEEAILFWPGLIEDIHFKTQISSKQDDKGKLPETRDVFSDGSKAVDDDKMPWKLIHMWLYKIRLLVVSKTVFIDEGHILPYQSHAPDNRLLSLLQSIEIDPGPERVASGNATEPPLSQSGASSQANDPEAVLLKSFEAVDPFPPEAPKLGTMAEREDYFKSTIGAYVMAIQIASRVTMYWTPSDEWEAKLTVPGPTARRASAFSSSSRDALPSREAHVLGKRILGVMPEHTTYTQKRYQGLWWGPERIWMGDLVRLKLARFQLAPDGAATIKKPSGIGKSSRSESLNNISTLDDLFRNHGRDSTVPTANGEAKTENYVPPPTSTIGSGAADGDVQMADDDENEEEGDAASRRSLFMRIDGFFIVQISTDDGREVHNECRMCGMLYELADDDWESDEESSFTEVPASPDTLDVANPAAATAGSDAAPGAIGARGLAQLYHDSAIKQAQTLFPPNPELLSDIPMDTDAPAPLPESASNGSVTAVETALATVHSSESVAAPPLSDPTGDTVVSTTTTTTATVTITTSPPAASTSPAAPATSSPAPVAAPSSTPPLDAMLSGPASPATRTHPLPPAPPHLRFRPILRGGHEAVLPLTLLAGRYYPDLLGSPLLAPRVAAALRDSFSSVASPQGAAPPSSGSDAQADAPVTGPLAHAPLWALAGLVGGAHNAVDASLFLPSRVRMVREAERVAWAELARYWRQRVAERKATIVID